MGRRDDMVPGSQSACTVCGLVLGAAFGLKVRRASSTSLVSVQHAQPFPAKACVTDKPGPLHDGHVRPVVRVRVCAKSFETAAPFPASLSETTDESYPCHEGTPRRHQGCGCRSGAPCSSAGPLEETKVLSSDHRNACVSFVGVPAHTRPVEIRSKEARVAIEDR